MRILIVNGSPRGARGNTHVITQAFAEGAEKAGAHVETVLLVEKDIRHCRGCFTCWRVTPGRCVIRDDMDELLERLVAADVVVFAMPLYVDNVTGLMKDFMDRLIPLVDPHFDKDESGECRHPMRKPRTWKFVVISNSGFPEQSQFQVLRLLFRRFSRNTFGELAGEIYRGAGELLSAPNVLLKPIIASYKKALRKAGAELVDTGRLSEQTMADLEKPLVPEHLYIRGANKHWDKATAAACKQERKSGSPDNERSEAAKDA